MSVDYIPPGTRLYLTPDSIPVGRFCRVINIPDDPTWIGLVDGVLSALFDPARWRQFGALTTEEAAGAWQAMMLESWGEHCMDCLDIMSCFSTYTPALGVTYGLDEDGNPEQSFDGGTTWFPVTDTGAVTQIPALTSTPGVDNDAKKCLAAQRAVNSLNTLFIQASAALAAGEWGTNTEAIQGLYQVLNIVLSEFKPIFELISLFITHWVGDLLTAFAETGLTSDEQDALLCLLYDNATVSASGVVTFDYMYIFNHIDDALTIASSIGMSYYLLTIGADGLNRAGNVNNASTADCGGCAPCADITEAFTSGPGEWVIPASADNSVWSATGGHSNPGCMIGTSGTYPTGNTMFDMRRECDVVGVHFWGASVAGNWNYYLSYFDAAHTLLRSTGLVVGSSTPDYKQVGESVSVPSCRYIVITVQSGSGNSKLDDVTIDVA